MTTATTTEKQFLSIMTTLRKYDEQQQKKRGHNPYAFGHYCRALQNVRAHVAADHELRTAILNEFVGSLANRIVKACGFEKMTDDELSGYGLVKLPEIPDEDDE